MRELFEKFVAKYGRLPTEVDPDYLEMLRMSKYKILATPYYKPAKCANCGATKDDGRRYVDFGLDIDWYGIVYLCGECLHDIAVNVGLYDNLTKQLELANQEIARLTELQGKGAELHETVTQAFRELDEHYNNLHPTSVDAYVIPDPDPVPLETTSEQGTNETESGTTGTKPRATKSTSSSGSKNVRSLADLLDDSGK